MTFDEILVQVLELLQREKRVSYRALKRRFDLDNTYLEDIKDELIDAKKLAVDEENCVLVWTGNVEGTAKTVSPSEKPVSLPPASQDTPAVHPPVPLATSPTSDAERRQLTVMFIH